MDYLDFEIAIGPGSGPADPVAIIRSPAGEAREAIRLPFDGLVLQNRLLELQNALLRSGGQHRQALSPDDLQVRDFGQALFDALFAGNVRSRYDVSRERAQREGKGLRLKLAIESAALAALPWEFLYDPRQAEYLCLSLHTPLVRYFQLPRHAQPLAVTPPLRILAMIASPLGLPPLDIARERQRLQAALGDLQARGLVDLVWLAGQTGHDLQQALRGGPWHVFHFMGHGGFDRAADEGFLALADEDGEVQRMSATQLGRLLADHASLRLVLLNACEGARGSTHDIFSSTAAILVRRGIPAVLAMQYAITDWAAVAFARFFYEALADGMPVDAAVTEARKALSLSIPNSVEWGVPVLCMHAPDGVLFNVRKPNPAPIPAPHPAPVPPRPDPELWRTTLLWVLVNAVGWAVSFALVPALRSLSRFPFVSGSFIGAISLAIVGCMQWLMLRRHIPQAERWVLATILSGAVGVFWILPDVLKNDLRLLSLAAIITGAVTGIAQWWSVRNLMFKPGWWILASAMGFLIGFGLIAPSADLVGTFLTRALGGAIYGIITSFALASIFRRSAIDKQADLMH